MHDHHHWHFGTLQCYAYIQDEMVLLKNCAFKKVTDKTLKTTVRQYSWSIASKIQLTCLALDYFGRVMYPRFTHICPVYFSGTWVTIRQLECQSNDPEQYGSIHPLLLTSPGNQNHVINSTGSMGIFCAKNIFQILVSCHCEVIKTALVLLFSNKKSAQREFDRSK